MFYIRLKKCRRILRREPFASPKKNNVILNLNDTFIMT
jgi:hypothetical protein